MVARVIPVEPFDLVIFGGTGDLARRKILPGLFRRFCDGQIKSNSRIIGAARASFSREDYIAFVTDAIGEFGGIAGYSKATLEGFLEIVDYVQVDAKSDDGCSMCLPLNVCN